MLCPDPERWSLGLTPNLSATRSDGYAAELVCCHGSQGFDKIERYWPSHSRQDERVRRRWARSVAVRGRECAAVAGGVEGDRGQARGPGTALNADVARPPGKDFRVGPIGATARWVMKTPIRARSLRPAFCGLDQG